MAISPNVTFWTVCQSGPGYSMYCAVRNLERALFLSANEALPGVIVLELLY
ncbi:UNVERIFIED_CONTAM: hypothetical protein FKN15_009484 [Acipenser sinensis]